MKSTRESLTMFVERIVVYIGEAPWNAESYKVEGWFLVDGIQQSIELWSSSKEWKKWIGTVRLRTRLKAEIAFNERNRSTFTRDIGGQSEKVLKIATETGGRIVVKWIGPSLTPVDACVKVASRFKMIRDIGRGLRPEEQECLDMLLEGIETASHRWGHE